MPFLKSSHRSFRKKRKSRWKSRVFLLLILIAAVWSGYVYLWKPVVAWFEPRVQIVESQKEAMGKLNSILSIWDSDTQKLEQIVSTREKLYGWMQDGKARESLDWLLVQELGSRGKWNESHAMLLPLLEKQVKKVGAIPGEERELIMKRCYDSVLLMLKRGDMPHAEQLLDMVIEQGDGGDVDTYIDFVKMSSDIKLRAGKLKEAASLVEKIKTDRVWDKIHKNEAVKETVRLLLFSDYVMSRDGGKPVTQGRELAKSLLERARMTSCPEMGVVILSDIYGTYSRKDLTPAEIDSIFEALEKALICFRATEADMSYIPEVMVGMARMKLLKSRTSEALEWINRAEGAAMTLGVDKPRILTGQSIKEDIAFLRGEVARVTKAHKTLKDIDAMLNDADTYIQNKAWGLAESSLRNVREMIQQHTVFARGYMPICQEKRARMYVGQEKWEEASAVYEKILSDWNSLGEEEKQVLNSNLEAFGVCYLYENIHKELADVCLKLDRITRSKQLLQAIGVNRNSTSK